MKTMIAVLGAALMSAPVFAFSADHTLNAKWGGAYHVEMNDEEILEVRLPKDAFEQIKFEVIDASQMVGELQCELLGIRDRGPRQGSVILYMGETNRDDGVNGCEIQLSGSRGTVSISYGYDIND